MKTSVLVILFGLGFVSGSSVAQKGADSPVKSNELKIEGKVKSVETVPLSDPTYGGIHFTLDVAGKPVNVQVAPHFVKEYNAMALQPGDEVMVVGFTFRMGDVKATKVKRK